MVFMIFTNLMDRFTFIKSQVSLNRIMDLYGPNTITDVKMNNIMDGSLARDELHLVGKGNEF